VISPLVYGSSPIGGVFTISATFSFSLPEKLDAFHIANVFETRLYQSFCLISRSCGFANVLVFVLEVDKLSIFQRILNAFMPQ
jgi:hypothetical protein